MHFISLAALLAIAPAASPSHLIVPPPARLSIGGRVTDSSGVFIPEARVQIVELNRTTETDESGHYLLTGIAPGTYRIAYTAIGYRARIETVSLTIDMTHDVVLRRSLIELPTIQVTASANATDPLTSPQPTAVLTGAVLEDAQAPSLGETLNQVAGVHSLSTGTGIGKPVIRGLTSNRVLILDNGQRMETSQWGDEHGPNVETANAERVEVIRGPASVLYGSDALGGVINIIQRPLPDALNRSPFIRGSLSTAYVTNNKQPDGSLLLEAATGGWGVRANVSGRSSEDLKTPSYTLWNSENRALGGSGSLGYRGTWGSMSATFTGRNERIQLTDEDPAETPTQRISTQRARLVGEFPLSSSRIEITGSFERNRRREFEDDITTDVALGLLSKTYGADVHYHHAPLGKLAGTIGVSGQRIAFEKFGAETLIPENRTSDIGVFAFEQLDAGRSHFSVGARYDYRHMDVEADSDIGVAAQTRTWNSVSGNLGFLYQVAEPIALVLNVGRGYRAPSTFDLFSNGVHEGTLAFERGDSTLKTEKSLSTDVAFRAQTENLALEVGGFLNLIQDFIYTVPTGQIDPGSGLEIFQVTQGDARLVGVEVAAQYHPTAYLHLQGTMDLIRGTNTSTDNPLPSMPPFRATYFVRLEGGENGLVVNPYFQIGGETNGRQSRLDPSEAPFFSQAFGGSGYQSESYTLVNLGAGFAIPAAGTRFRFDFHVRNLFDKEYADFLSRIKTSARNPGMGRTLIAKLSTDF
jgi:iron complex outermembrane receptor protein